MMQTTILQFFDPFMFHLIMINITKGTVLLQHTKILIKYYCDFSLFQTTYSRNCVINVYFNFSAPIKLSHFYHLKLNSLIKFFLSIYRKNTILYSMTNGTKKDKIAKRKVVSIQRTSQSQHFIFKQSCQSQGQFVFNPFSLFHVNHFIFCLSSAFFILPAENTACYIYYLIFLVLVEFFIQLQHNKNISCSLFWSFQIQ